MMTMNSADLLIVGAGPAGMAAALMVSRAGHSVIVLDSQPEPGGQIWRNVKGNAGGEILHVLGAEYQRGLEAVATYLASDVVHIAEAEVSRIEPGWAVEYVHGGGIQVVRAKLLLLAVGAQERPTPFPGWTLPGVMTVGAAQILLKCAGRLPKGPVVIAGNGPLPLLFKSQMRAAGATPLAFLDTTPKGLVQRTMRNLPGALRDPRQLLKGLSLLASRSGRHITNVASVAAQGNDRLESVCFETGSGEAGNVEAATLLVHEGLVPSHQLAVSAGALLDWDVDQSAFKLLHDEWMQAEPAGLFLAGDGVRIGGAVSAEIQGKIAALGVLRCMGRLTDGQSKERAAPLRHQLARQEAFRRFLDRSYRPRLALLRPERETIICRCEELAAGTLRDIALQGKCCSPNQLKVFSRAGMGPCQGRQCGYAVHELIKSMTDLPANEVGLFNPRPPFAPLSVAMVSEAGEGLANWGRCNERTSSPLGNGT